MGLTYKCGLYTRVNVTYSDSDKVFIIVTKGLSILGFHSRDEMAMLVYKTKAKCRSSFA